MARTPKMPAFQFYTGDWKKDPALSLCSAATRGIWIDILCAMHDADRCGEVSGTVPQLARLARCSEAEMKAAIAELKDTDSATVTFCSARVTLVNRRMAGEHKKRQADAARQFKHRHGDEPPEQNGTVTEKSHPLSSSSSSSSSSDKKERELPPPPSVVTEALQTPPEVPPEPPGDRATEDSARADWEQFYEAYPPDSDSVKVGHVQGQMIFCHMPPAERQQAIQAARIYAQSEKAAKGMVQRMERWLDSGDWRAYLQKSTGPPRKKLVGGVDLSNLDLAEP